MSAEDGSRRAIGRDGDLLVPDLLRQSAYVLHRPGPGAGEPDVRGRDPQIRHQVEQTHLDVEGGIVGRRRLQSVAQRLIVQVHARPGPVEHRFGPVPVVNQCPLVHEESVALRPGRGKGDGGRVGCVWERHPKRASLAHMNDLIAKLSAHERIRAARHHIERTDEVTLARQAALSAIPAPTGAESQRAARAAELFREVGLRDVTIDEVGNVHGWLRGDGGAGTGNGAAPVVLAAHLDTVFGPDVRVAVERRGDRMEGPGISDNARGLAALIAVAEALVRARVHTTRPILFVATVGEEGSGDLRGVKYLLNGKNTIR